MNLAQSQAGYNEQVEPDVQTVSGVETMQGLHKSEIYQLAPLSASVLPPFRVSVEVSLTRRKSGS